MACPGLMNIVDNYDNELPEIRVQADVEKAARYGLRTFDIAGTIRTALHGSGDGQVPRRRG